ncbi:MAG TPA: hypothetical protein VFZ58_05805 [Candidatus Saccharimonadales bacterium]
MPDNSPQGTSGSNLQK